MKAPIFIAISCSSLISISSSATLFQDFQGVTVPALPSGWSVVGGATFESSSTTGNPGQSLSAGAGASSYLVNSGVAFNAASSFTGTFDFYLVESGNYTNISFYVGDIQDGLTGTSAGEFIRFDLREKTFGSRANAYNGDGSVIINDSSNNREIFTNQWNTATIDWTPTSGTTGDLTLSWVRPTSNTEPGFNITGYTFDSNDVYFGFGGYDDPGFYDNINITGTAIPETSAALFGLVGLTLLIRRRR